MEGQHYILRKRDSDNNEEEEEEEKEEKDNNDRELIILRLPPLPPPLVRRKRKNTTTTCNTENNKNIKNYFKNLQMSTEKSISILTNNFGINQSHFYRGTNFYCPFHENKYTSKSPSATFTSKNHTFTCFSTKCPLRKTSTTIKDFVKINSIHLFNALTDNNNNNNNNKNLEKL